MYYVFRFAYPFNTLHRLPAVLLLNFLIGEKRNAYMAVKGKPEGRRQSGRPRHRRNNIEVDLEDVDWIDLAHDMD
jgi:hypothetical protein